MEYSKQSYIDILQMPVKKLYDYLKWKQKLEESKLDQIQEMKS